MKPTKVELHLKNHSLSKQELNAKLKLVGLIVLEFVSGTPPIAVCLINDFASKDQHFRNLFVLSDDNRHFLPVEDTHAEGLYQELFIAIYRGL